jgi:hypothetical protein
LAAVVKRRRTRKRVDRERMVLPAAGLAALRVLAMHVALDLAAARGRTLVPPPRTRGHGRRVARHVVGWGPGGGRLEARLWMIHLPDGPTPKLEVSAWTPRGRAGRLRLFAEAVPAFLRVVEAAASAYADSR